MIACKDCDFCIDRSRCGHTEALREYKDYVEGTKASYPETCIAMRLYGTCGDDAKLFVPKKEADPSEVRT